MSRPTSPPPRRAFNIALRLVVGFVLSVGGGLRARHELDLSLHGVRAHGTVADWLLSRHGNTAEVDLAAGAGPPIRVHLVEVSGSHPWAEGMPVDVVCPELRAGVAGCEIDDWRDRFLVPVGSLAAGFAFLAWGIGSAVGSRGGGPHNE